MQLVRSGTYVEADESETCDLVLLIHATLADVLVGNFLAIDLDFNRRVDFNLGFDFQRRRHTTAIRLRRNDADRTRGNSLEVSVEANS